MNKILYTSALNKYKKWVIENKEEIEDDFRERRTMCEVMQSYSKEKLEKLTEEEYRYIAASGDWEYPTPTRNDATMYNDWD